MANITITDKNNNVESFSLEKLTISLFELTYLIGEPNIELCEKISKSVFEKIEQKKQASLSKEELEEYIKEILLEKNKNLHEIYVTRHKKKDTQTQHIIKEKMFVSFLNLETGFDNPFNLKQRFSENPKLTDQIIEYIKTGVFYPSTNILTNHKTNLIFSSQTIRLSDCLEDIFDSLLVKSKCEKKKVPSAINLDNIRSKEALVSSTKKKACGIKNIIDFYILAQEKITDRKQKNAQNTFYINIEHPDAIDVIKNKTSKNNNFVFLIPDRFMHNLLENKVYYLKKEGAKTIETTKEEAEQTITPSLYLDFLFSKIIDENYFDFVFVDKLKNKNVFLDKTNELSSIGYQPVFENDSFFTGIIDVSKFVRTTGALKTFKWKELKEVIFNSVKFLDACIDHSEYLDESLEKNVKKTRRLYLSITGYFSLLDLLDVPFESDDALVFGENLSEFVSYYSKKASIELAKEKRPFLDYTKTKYLDNNVFEYSKGVQKTLFSEINKAKKLLTTKLLVDWTELKNNQRKFGIRNSTTYSVIFSDIYSIANNTTNTINPPENYKFVKIANENYSFLEGTPREKINNQHLIKLQNVFEKFCDGICNVNLFYEKTNQVIEDMKKDFIQTYKTNNLCYLPKMISKEDVFTIDDDSFKKSL